MIAISSGVARRTPTLRAAVLSLTLLTVALGGALAAEVPTRTPSGGGPAPRVADDLTESERTAIETRARSTIARLEAQGALESVAASAGAPVRFVTWPVVPALGAPDARLDTVSNFVDHDEHSPGAVRDFACGQRSYDTTGYDHAGTDIALWPFAWTRMDRNEALVVAAAAGTIVLKQDGNPDRNCSLDATTPWNAILVRHRDGTVAWYGHLKSGSLTTKPEGSAVRAGEFLGVVGSSGSSTGPHLHFEIHGTDGRIVDPFAGACNPEPAASWRAPVPYESPRINKVATHWAPPRTASCPATREARNLRQRFLPGDPIVYAVYLRDQLAGVPIGYEIVAPDGSVIDRWAQEGLETTSSASYWTWDSTVPANAAPGRWRLRVTFGSETMEHQFIVRQAR